MVEPSMVRMTPIMVAIQHNCDPVDCAKRLFVLITSGGLAAEFRTKPFGVLACCFTVLAAIMARASDSFDGDEAEPPVPVVFGQTRQAVAFDAAAHELSLALGVPQIEAATEDQPVGRSFWQLLAQRILDELAKLILDYLTK